MKMNSDYFVGAGEDVRGALRRGIFRYPAQGAVTDPRERLIQFKTNMDV